MLPSDAAKLREPELFLDQFQGHLVVLDEIQRVPELFPVLRGLVDRRQRPGQFLVLGSASKSVQAIPLRAFLDEVLGRWSG